MTYKDISDAGQGAKLKNQDIFGCLFYVRRLDVVYFNFIFTLWQPGVSCQSQTSMTSLPLSCTPRLQRPDIPSS